MSRPSEFLLAAAAGAYAGSGTVAWRVARNKLRYDPVFAALLRRGGLPDRGVLVDLGCGQGLLLSLLVAAREAFRRGEWPPAFPLPPLNLELRGVEIEPVRARVAQRALDGQARVVQGDVRDVEIPACTVVVLLDVLMYLERPDQRRVLEKAAAALEPGGLLLLREADAGAGAAFLVTRWGERVLELLRGRWRDRLRYRTAAEWAGLLETLGFSVVTEPMSEGTPFANVLFVCTKRDE